MNEKYLQPDTRMEDAPSELLADYERQRQLFLAEFCSQPELIDTKSVDTYFRSHGLQHFPIVTIPFNAEASTKARAIALDSKYPHPFIYEKFDPDRDFNNFWAAGIGWASPSHRLNFQFDTGRLMAEGYGEGYATRMSTGLYAHELAHSIFHVSPSLKVVRDQNSVIREVHEYYPLSGLYAHKYSADTTGLEYVPMWIEEAIAVYIDAQIARVNLPEGDGCTFDMEGSDSGDGMIWLNEHYVTRHPDYPNQPGYISGAVAGQALEILDTKVPDTIEKIFAIARGDYDSEAFRSEMHAAVGPDLYHLMFSNQPYSMWNSISTKIYKV